MRNPYAQRAIAEVLIGRGNRQRNGTNPWTFTRLPVPQQDWLFHRVGANRYVIRNVLSGKVLDARNSCVTQNGCKVQQWAMNSNDTSQVWIVTPAN